MPKWSRRITDTDLEKKVYQQQKELEGIQSALKYSAGGGGGSSTLEEVLTNGNDGGGLAITNIATPSSTQDAATKGYVDGLSIFPTGTKVYAALLTQTGTNAPTATELANTIGAIVWSRVSEGYYNATLSNVFTTNKTLIFINPFTNTDTPLSYMSTYQTSNSVLQFRNWDNDGTVSPADFFDYVSILILVFP